MEKEEEEIFRWVRVATLAFWDAYLNGDAEAKAFLQSDTVPVKSGGRAGLTTK